MIEQTKANPLQRLRESLFAIVMIACVLMLLSCSNAEHKVAHLDQALSPMDANSSNAFMEAEVTRVLDAITIQIETNGLMHIVRYLGVVAPVGRYSQPAKDFNSFLAMGKTVSVYTDIGGVDVDGAWLRYVYADGEMLNLKVLDNGWGEVGSLPVGFDNHEEFFKAESYARSNELGIWNIPVQSLSDLPLLTPTPEPNVNFAGGTLPAMPAAMINSTMDCDFSLSGKPMIKGDVERLTKERYYHVPGGLFYSTKTIDPEEGDQWLCTEAEAQAMGWKRSKR